MKHLYGLYSKVRLLTILAMALAVLTHIASQKNSAQSPSCLTSQWPAEGNANDTTGFNPGILQGGVTFAPGETGKAFSLDGSTGYVEVPINSSAMNSPVSFTWEAWINPSSLNYPVIFQKGSAVFNRAGLQIFPDGSLCSFLNSTYCSAISAAGVVQPGQFTKVTMLYDGGTQELHTYVNDVQVSSAAVSSTYSNTEPFLIGFSATPVGYNAHFQGLIDEVSFSSCAIPPTPTPTLCGSSTTSGLVGYWPEDGNANDVIGANNPSATNGISFVPGKVAQGVTVGTGGYIEVPDDANLDTPTITLTAWALPNGQATNNDVDGDIIIAKDTSRLFTNLGGPQVSIGLFWRASDNRFVLAVGKVLTVEPYIPSLDAFSPGQFYHVAGSYDGTTAKLYVNGQLEASEVIDGAIDYDHTVPWTIGSAWAGFRNAGYPRTWNGIIDDVRIYDRALSAAEIAALHGDCDNANQTPTPAPTPTPTPGNCTSTVLLDDNFDTENGGAVQLNYYGFANWNVTKGSVDLLGPGNDLLPGNGMYLDLDGSGGGGGGSGTMESKTTFTLNPGTYQLSFSLAGNQRGSFGFGPDTVNVSLGGVFAESFTLDASDPFRTITRTINVGTATSGNLVFEHLGYDFVGLLLDNVKLQTVTCSSPSPTPTPTPCGSATQQAGGVFATAQDPDFHGVQGANAVGAQHILQRAIAYVIGNKTSPRILLVTDLRNPGGTNSDSRLGLPAAGFNTFDVADYGSGQQGALDLHAVTFSSYDVIVVASDFGGWLRQDELDLLNARKNELIDYVNNGGGLVALAESGTNSTTSHDRYGFLPFLTSSVNFQEQNTSDNVTAAGAAMGLTNADLNGNFTHNIFASTGGMDVIEVDGQDQIISLATRQHIGADGVVPCDQKPVPPVVTGGLPPDGGILGPGTTGDPGHVSTTVTGTGHAGCTIQLTVTDPHETGGNNNRVLTTPVDSSGNWAIPITLDDCDPIIDIMQTCDGVSSDPVHRHIFVDGTPPVFTGGGPGDGVTFITGGAGGSANIILDGSANDPNTSHCVDCGGVSYQWLLIGGGVGGADLILGGGGAGGTLVNGGSGLSIDLPPGDYDIEVIVTDAAGNKLIKHCHRHVCRPVTITGGLPGDGGIYGPGDGIAIGKVTRLVTGTGNPGCSVQIAVTDTDHPQLIDNHKTYNVPVDNSGNWSLPLTLDDCDPVVTVIEICDGVSDGGDVIRQHIYVDGTPPTVGLADGTIYVGTGGTGGIVLDAGASDAGSEVPNDGLSYDWYIIGGGGAGTPILLCGGCPGNYTINEPAGDYYFQVVVTDRAGNKTTKRCHRTVLKRPTAITYTGDVLVANGGIATLQGVLTDITPPPGPNPVPVVGRTVSLTLGNDPTAQSCTGITDSTGFVRCTVSPVNQPLGPSGMATDVFAGDDVYLPSNNGAHTLVFAFATATGNFVIGDVNAKAGNQVTFWGAQWAKQNSLSLGSANSSFKGFENQSTTSPPSCGRTWTTDPGNSSGPPASIPSYLGVIVSSSIAKSGSNIAGNIPQIVIVKTDAGYAPNPGHSGTGTVVAVFCK